jgi:hypothetical protein
MDRFEQIINIRKELREANKRQFKLHKFESKKVDRADYPWEECIIDQTERYGDEDTAKKVCGAIKAMNNTKEDMEIEPNPCWEGYEPIGLKDDGSPNCVPIKEEMEYVNGLPPYVDEVPRKKKKKDMSKVMFANDEKRIVIGPAMIPDLKIFRKDSKGNPYYVYFSSETIKMIAEKYMKNKYIDNNDTNHDGEAAKDVYVIESWIKDSENDKSTDYGYSDLPVGTWFVSMKVKNDEVWKQVKEGKLNGFSVSGYFEEVAQFCMEEMFLKELADLLKNIKD